jgi:GrpB-like predicted nucleotidyltransferase (UPF0157 family)
MSISITPYQSKWPEAFRAHGQAIRAAVGEAALAIHHIGSTSVPGLAAKDVIDIQVTVADFDAPVRAALEGLGYVLREHLCDHCPPGMELATAELEKRFYKHLSPDVNLHVRIDGRFNQRYPLLFRDYLRATPMAADAYGEIKRQLARYFPTDMDAYYDIKDPVCDVLMAGAFAWAEAIKWVPGPSDA